jgi:hypothetical protein
LAENSKTFRLPTYLHERLIAIRGAKYALEDQGISPTTEVKADYVPDFFSYLKTMTFILVLRNVDFFWCCLCEAFL